MKGARTKSRKTRYNNGIHNHVVTLENIKEESIRLLAMIKAKKACEVE